MGKCFSGVSSLNPWRQVIAEQCILLIKRGVVKNNVSCPASPAAPGVEQP